MRINKYFLTFTTLFLFLGVFVSVALQKYLPLLFQHVVYYCQSLGHPLSMRIPHQLGGLLLLGITTVIILLLLRLTFFYFKVYFQRKRLYRQLTQSPDFDALVKKLQLTNKAFLVKSNKTFAFCHGIRNPKIYVSSRLLRSLTPLELEAVLRHERYHLKKQDSVTLLVASLCQSLFPFFPLITDLIYNYRIAREIEADEEAIKGLGNPKPLLVVLRKFLTHEPAPPYAFASAIAAPDTLEARINVLAGKNTPRQTYRQRNILASVTSILVLYSLVTLPVQAIDTTEQEGEVMMVCLQSDSCATWCKENNTVTPYSPAPNASYPYTPSSTLR